MKNGMSYVRKQHMPDYKKKLSFLKHVLTHKVSLKGDEVPPKKIENSSLVFGVSLLTSFYLRPHDDTASMVAKES